MATHSQTPYHKEIVFAHFQAYAAELSEGNRLQCANSSKPLLTAVDSLVTYANSPEFARVPAKISAEVSSPFSIYIRVSDLNLPLFCLAGRECIYCLRLSMLAYIYFRFQCL